MLFRRAVSIIFKNSEQTGRSALHSSEHLSRSYFVGLLIEGAERRPSNREKYNYCFFFRLASTSAHALPKTFFAKATRLGQSFCAFWTNSCQRGKRSMSFCTSGSLTRTRLDFLSVIKITYERLSSNLK